MYRVPTRTGKIREVFPVREKSENFKILPESQGKVREFCNELGKIRSENKKKIYGESLKSVVSRNIFVED